LTAGLQFGRPPDSFRSRCTGRRSPRLRQPLIRLLQQRQKEPTFATNSRRALLRPDRSGDAYGTLLGVRRVQGKIGEGTGNLVNVLCGRLRVHSRIQVGQRLRTGAAKCVRDGGRWAGRIGRDGQLARWHFTRRTPNAKGHRRTGRAAIPSASSAPLRRGQHYISEMLRITFPLTGIRRRSGFDVRNLSSRTSRRR
jgi:hypothetical protein